jgi:hypothetical protein
MADGKWHMAKLPISHLPLPIVWSPQVKHAIFFDLEIAPPHSL